MQLKRIRVLNYSSFKDSGWIELSPGINLIVGQNNAGKSALLRIFDKQFKQNLHRDSERFRAELLEQQEAQFEIAVSNAELFRGILISGRDVFWPLDSGQSFTQALVDSVLAYFQKPTYLFKVRRNSGTALGSYTGPLHEQFTGSPTNIRLHFELINGKLEVHGQHVGAAQESLLTSVNNLWQSNLFSFNAQRYHLGTSQFTREDRLQPDAGNLAGILSKMQGEQGSLFERLIEHLREIFPTVQNLSVTPTSGFEIRVWPTLDRSRGELGFPLDDCGTGVAQVIAILTVAMTFEEAVIVIDEISAFLHPAAAKALLRILQTEYAQHQYIITTHSPEVLSAGSPGSVHLVRRQGYESTVERIDLAKIDDLRDLANHLGVSMTDVFAAERIIWVEGPTEEIYFPYIQGHNAKTSLSGITVTSVIATGDFNAKRIRRDLVFEVYRRLSKATAPLVKTVTFSFDRETLSEEQMSELKRDAGGRLAFLPRRHFECYLLDPAAIAAFINSQVPDLAQKVTGADVLPCLQKSGGDPAFKASKQWNDEITDEAWLAEVDAASLIKHVCNELTDNRLSFVKNRQSFDILKHIMEHNPASLGGLIGYVNSLYKMAMNE